jgi:hypothetical protein
LNLNIWSAANSTDAKLPVVIWSYPAYSTAADDLFDGGSMADKGVVFVSYNLTLTFYICPLPPLTSKPALFIMVLDSSIHNIGGGNEYGADLECLHLVLFSGPVKELSLGGVDGDEG